MREKGVQVGTVCAQLVYSAHGLLWSSGPFLDGAGLSRLPARIPCASFANPLVTV